ncbi:hypothetical protein CYB_2453 [Synechococcus sp. JA-2-3B'a(2-13)]|nr:hypothetical protein CYB_2453 [Synechococcus sp. JA-2-3B'a(2-13)]
MQSLSAIRTSSLARFLPRVGHCLGSRHPFAELGEVAEPKKAQE